VYRLQAGGCDGLRKGRGTSEEVTEVAELDDVHATVAHLLDGLGLELVDLEMSRGLVRVTVDRPGGVDLDGLADANKAISRALDDLDPLPGHYSLEVSSPGVERRLRTAAQFERAIGEVVNVRTQPGADGPRRVVGHLLSADADGFVVAGDDLADGSVRVRYEDVQRAHTVFEWGGAPKPGKGAGTKAAGAPRHETTGRVATP
jgi:ribosome maturation factor RimP